MKLSLAWLFDHIDADWHKIDVPALVNLFNQTTAEIEGFEKISYDLTPLTLVRVEEVSDTQVELFSPEYAQKITLSVREGVAVGLWYLVTIKNNQYAWTTLAELWAAKEGLVPALSCPSALQAGEWKKTIPSYDYIIHLDNKSVNHRPDMWGHRGVAREVAAMLKLPFKSLESGIIEQEIKEFPHISPSQPTFGMGITIENPQFCKNFTGLVLSQVTNTASVWWMVFRLAAVDSKPINALVDLTNYVMLDLGQPMHAFDMATLSSDTIVVRQAQEKEQVELLDGQTVTLSAQDCVVTDGKKIISVAGIMGSKGSGVSLKSSRVFLEAACFDAATIRKTAARLKKRTESSARFEKSLDPYQTVYAIQRFLRLLNDCDISYTAVAYGASVGELPELKTVTISHEFIEQRLGIRLAPEFIQRTLTVLEFAVISKGDIYNITIPSFRATKDVAIPEDIVEEIGRFYGYTAIPDVLPCRQTEPFSLAAVDRIRMIKQLLAYGFGMKELTTYAFFDESFLSVIGWQPGKTLQVQNPVSENWQRLITSLVPNLLKAIYTHAQACDHMSFFEWARQWPQNDQEEKVLTGIFIDQKHPLNFYEVKQKLAMLFAVMHAEVEWIKPSEALAPWYLPHQTAYLMHKGNRIGIAGMADPVFLSRIAQGSGFIFELNAEFLQTYQAPLHRFVPASKYPDVQRDISILVPRAVTVADIQNRIAGTDTLITQVQLIDFFEKAEWKDQKSLTFRLVLRNPARTLTTVEADHVMQEVNNVLKTLGATIR